MWRPAYQSLEFMTPCPTPLVKGFILGWDGVKVMGLICLFFIPNISILIPKSGLKVFGGVLHNRIAHRPFIENGQEI